MTVRRSPSDAILGLWLTIAAVGLPLVGILWRSDIPKLILREPVPPHVFMAFVLVAIRLMRSALMPPPVDVYQLAVLADVVA